MFLCSYILIFLYSYILIFLYSYILIFLYSYILTFLHSYSLTVLQSYILTVLHSYILTFLHSYTPQSTEVFYLDHGETANGPIEKVYVTMLVTPMGLASSFNGGIFKIMVKKWANFENSINHPKNGLV